MGVETDEGVEWEGQEGERNRDRIIEQYAKTSLKTREAKRNGCELDRGKEFPLRRVSLPLTYTGDRELPRVS